MVPVESSPELDFHVDEILEMAKSMKAGKGAGPNGVPDVTIKLAMTQYSHYDGKGRT